MIAGADRTTGMSPVDEAELLGVAEAAARASAHELLRRFGHQQAEIRAKSTPTDLVSEADVSAESAIRALLARERPGDAILGEEGGATGEGELRWVVDPLDGTINFLFGIPAFAVSVACEDGDGALAGVVLDPVRDECFTATRSGPARLNGAELQVTSGGDLATALVATGFGYATYYERGVHHWDVAAGLLIAQRAGLVTRELPAAEPDPYGVLVAPPALVEPLAGLVVG
jgi:myo-inositol-1(or 4)-monophosphatase